ncbi:MAG: type IV secretion system protein [Betaproteobacteria bacterium]|nr:type IV secretion system protein [Betaproteobacteria bacterium]
MTNFDILGTFMNTFLNSISFGYAAIQPAVNFILAGLITIVIAITAILTWAFGDFEGMIRGLIGKILLIGFILLLVQHWQAYTDDIGTGLAQLGLRAGDNPITPVQFLEDPTTITYQGWELAKQIWGQGNAVPGGHFGVDNLPDKFIYGLAGIGVFLSFLIVSLQVLVTFLEFKIINLAALIFVPFAIWPKTEFLSQRTFAFMFSSGIKLFVLALVISIGLTFTVKLTVSTTPDMQNALAVLTGSVMFMALSLAAPNLAQSLISGSPQLTASTAAMGAGALAATVGGAGVMGARALGGIGQAGGAMIEHGNRRNAEGFEQMRRAATAGGGGNANATTLSQMAKAAATGSGSAPPNDNPPSGEA